MSLPEVCVVYLLRPRSGGGEEVLLGRKLLGLGLGKWVAPGGKLEPGEDAAAAAVREVAEEVGIRLEPTALEHLGRLTYPFPYREAWSQVSTVFRARGEFPEPVESDELGAAWVSIDEIPYDQMWDDARTWLPNALAGVFVDATFEFGEDLSTVTWSDHPGWRTPSVQSDR